MRAKNIGIKDVAAAAGVSATTVSHVLNDVASARISQETRDRVRSAAGQLGYGPNSVARALRTSRTALLGLIIEDMGASPHTGQIISGADGAARTRGYNLLVINTSGSLGPESTAGDVESLLVRRVDGILYAPKRHRQLQLPSNLASIPAVLVDAVGGGGGVAAVAPDEDGGARAAVGYLLAAGHTRIGFINTADDAPDARGRLRAFQAASLQAGLDGGAAPTEPAQAESAPAGAVSAGRAPVESGQPNEQGGHAAAHRILTQADRPTALVCHNETMAMGAYRAAAELGLAIPADLSVVAFAEHGVLAANLYPALTTVDLPHYGMAARAAEVLIDAIEGTTDGAVSTGPATVYPCTLAARDSVAPPRDSTTPRGNF